MKLRCGIVRRIAAGRTGEPLPDWVSRHLSRCECCAAEAAAYRRLQSVVKDNLAECGACGLSWQDLRSTLPMRSARPSHRLPVLAAAGSLALIVLVCLGVFLQSGRQDVIVVQKPVVQTRNDADVNKPDATSAPASKSGGAVSDTNAGKTQPKSAAPDEKRRPSQRPVKKRMSPLQLQANKTVPQRVKHVPPSVDRPNANVAAAEPASSYKVVGAEEHVISVVGVSNNGEAESDDTNYIIRTTGTEEDTVALL